MSCFAARARFPLYFTPASGEYKYPEILRVGGGGSLGIFGKIGMWGYAGASWSSHRPEAVSPFGPCACPPGHYGLREDDMVLTELMGHGWRGGGSGVPVSQRILAPRLPAGF